PRPSAGKIAASRSSFTACAGCSDLAGSLPKTLSTPVAVFFRGRLCQTPFSCASFILLTKPFDFAQNQRCDAARGMYRLQVSQFALVGRSVNTPEPGTRSAALSL